jgi:hypothetical protein
MKKNLFLTILFAVALTASSQDFAPLAWQTDLSATPNSTYLAQAEEYPVPRIAFHVNPAGYFLFGPMASLEVGLTKHLVLNGHVRLSGLGKMTEETIYTDGEDIPYKMKGTAFGGGPVYFFGNKLSKPYAGIMFEYDNAEAGYAEGEVWEWFQNDKSMIVMVNAGYRLRFKWGLFVNFGVYGGYASVKDHWDYVDTVFGNAEDPSPRDDKFTRPYLNGEVSIGFGF